MDLKKFLQSEGLLLPDIQPKGWECPKCGRVYSPTTPMCFYCGGEQTVTATSVTGDVEEPRYCDRNICMTNEYNGIECENCEVTLHNKKVKEAVPYCTEENCPIYQNDLSCERCNR